MNITLNTFFSDYIVPIRYNSILLGTGIIHKSLLITAAHVVEELQCEKREFSFLYHKQPLVVNWDSELFFEYDKEKLHNTQKPIALMEYLIKTFSNEGELVLDNCMGSGSTGVACVNTNRRFIGIEKEQKYFDIAKERITKVVQ